MSNQNPLKDVQESTPVTVEVQESTPVKVEKKEAVITQSDKNNIIIKAKDEAITNLLSELGIESTGKLKDKLSAFKAWEDSQKTELERAQAEAERIAADLEAERKSKKALDNKVIALSKNIPNEKVDKYLKLAEAYPDVELSQALDMAIEEFPFEQSKNNTVARFGTQTVNQGGGENEIESQMSKFFNRGTRRKYLK